MLNTETELQNLDVYLTKSKLYSEKEYNAELINVRIVEEWRSRIESALKEDFQKLQIDISCTESHFELFGDQGATVWSTRVIVNDHSSSEKIAVCLRAVVDYRVYRVFAEESVFRQQSYQGTNVQCELLFNRLKSVEKFGYSSDQPIAALLSR